MTDPLDYSMFLKLMNMTTSQYDNEVLTAIRLANAALARTNQTWADLLAGKVVMITGPDGVSKPTISTGVRYTNAAEIDAYFDKLYQRHLGTFKEWVDSVHEWWEQKGFLTEAQYKTLKKSALR